MLYLFFWWRPCHAVILLCLLWSSEALNLAASFPSPTEKEPFIHKNYSDFAASSSYQTPSLESSEERTLLPSASLATKHLNLLSSSISSLASVDHSSQITKSTLSTEPVSIAPVSWFSAIMNDTILNSSNKDISKILEPHLTATLPSSSYEPTNSMLLHHTLYSSDSIKASLFSSNSETIKHSDLFSHFHTPLMSLLLTTQSSSWQIVEPTLTNSNQFSNPAQSSTTSSSDNEVSDSNHLPVPTEQDHKKLLMIVLRAEDCTRFSKSDFEKMLSKLMAKFGFNDVIPEVSNAKCYSHLNINVTVGGPTPTLRFLPNMDGKNNFTVDVLNRTFRIVKLEKVDLKLEKTKSSNVTSNIIAAVAKHESVAYIAVGVSFGLILVICVTVCCIKCCCLKKPQKRYGVPKGTHVRLRPEDYTLTPIPRPTSLYVDYYRGSGTADIYSTTSAGSIASTTPTVEQGVVQPFDTSIVPLEDSSNLPLDSSRDPSVESVPVQSDLKTFNIHSLAGKGFRATSTDSKEKLNPKTHSKKVEIKPSGVANPTFQRY